MIKKIEHVGIAVKSLTIANDLYTRLLGDSPYKTEEVSSEGVLTSFYRLGDVKVELLEGITDNNAISKFVDNRGEGIHHIAFEVENIEAEIEQLQKSGFIFISEKPKRGADNKLVCFIHPKSANGVLIELVQEIK